MEKKKENLNTEEIKKIEEKANLEEKKRYNKIVGGFVIVVVLVIAFLIGLSINKDLETSFDYHGTDFYVVDEIAPYRTMIVAPQTDPITGGATSVPFYIYLRNDPRELEKKVPFEGDLTLMKNMAITATEGFNCEGKGIVGVTNMVRLLEGIGVNVVRDDSADCSPDGSYLFMRLTEGNETKITNIGPNCYEMQIHNCEILESTERFMLESLVEINKQLKANGS